MASRGLWLGSLLFGAGFVACVTNHEALEKKPAGRAISGAGGTSASGGAPSHRGGTGGDGTSGSGHSDDEPPGESVLTLVNGIVDAPSVALCLAKVDGDGTVTPLGSPLTDAFEYGQSLVLREVDGVEFESDGLEPIVIAGKLELIAGLDCDAAINRARSEEELADRAGGETGQGGAAGDGNGMNAPSADSGGSAGEGGSTSGEGGGGGARPAAPARSALRVRGLPMIAAGTLNAGRSWLYAANGCLGGTAFDGELAAEYCGAGYTPREPTASAVLVSLSRQVAAEHVALQVVHASLANAQVELRSRPPFPSTATGVSITTVIMGQVAPRPASTVNSLDDLGVSRKYQVSVEAGGKALYAQPWSSVLSQGGLKALKNGQGYALVFNGPSAELPSVPDSWNAPTLTVIAVDPE